MDWLWFYFSFKGRISRRQMINWYWLPMMALVVPVLSYMMINVEVGMLLYAAFCYVTLWPSLAVTAKRLHDLDKSAWWLLILLIPFIGPLWVGIESGCLRGTIGYNRFGPDPLEGPEERPIIGVG